MLFFYYCSEKVNTARQNTVTVSLPKQQPSVSWKPEEPVVIERDITEQVMASLRKRKDKYSEQWNMC